MSTGPVTADASARSGTRRERSLGTRWNHSIVLFTLIVTIGGLVNFVGGRLLLESFRTSAVLVERESTTSAELRNNIVTDAIVVSAAASENQHRQLLALDASIRAGYAALLDSENTPAARALLEESLAEWRLMIFEAPPSASAETRGASVAKHAQAILSKLDQAGAASRADVRDQLDSDTNRERIAVAALFILQVIAIAFAVRMGRRMRREVLLPIASLRDSANHLAAGELNHRVVIDRTDELGELGTSFNAMADAIAGNQRHLSQAANTDSLTGLANRAAFGIRLDASLNRPERRSGDQAVLFADLDDFKDVNDILGHAAGDELLRVVARRLNEVVRTGDVVARLGGDEFAILLDDIGDGTIATEIAQRIIANLASPMLVGTHRVHVGVSVGMAIRRRDSTPDVLMHEADVAMYAAKGKGKNRVERYDPGYRAVSDARQALRSDIGDAVGRGQLVIDYQPIIDLETGAIVGLEALVRWRHPERGLLPPSAFIDLAEETGAIVGIGKWVLDTAVHQLRRWQRAHDLPNLWMSINVSMRQLEGKDFAKGMTDVIDAVGVDPANIVVEVTESVLAEPGGAAAAALTTLREPGIRIALDDFGTGYSSINYLRELPVDILKIDRSFTIDAEEGSAGNALLEAIVALGHNLELDVIPEGIEDVEQLDQLRAMDCRIGQGYLLSRPENADTIDAMLTAPFRDPFLFPEQSEAPAEATADELAEA